MELENLNWDVVELSEVHRKDEKLIQLHDSNHLFYHRGKQTNASSATVFLVIQKLAANILKFSGISDGIAWIVVRLSKR